MTECQIGLVVFIEHVHTTGTQDRESVVSLGLWGLIPRTMPTGPVGTARRQGSPHPRTFSLEKFATGVPLSTEVDVEEEGSADIAKTVDGE
jgi:hypothetical protein